LEVDPQDPQWAEAIKAFAPEKIFNCLHGEWGEDGRIQGVLDYMSIPYTHSGVLASALAMDKDKSKAIFAQAGLPLAKGKLMHRLEAAKAHPMALPYVVKPNAQGSSVGVFIVREGANRPPEELLDPDWTYGEEVMVEEFIAGKELTVAVLGERALAVTEILPSVDFYDFRAKYGEGGSRHEVPAKIPTHIAEAAMRAAETAHKALGCRGLTRADFRFDPKTDRLVLLEVNTQPGMTPTSLAPEQAAYVGMSYDALCAWILEDASWPR
jgi:D-alanine-D-alanine ligase